MDIAQLLARKINNGGCFMKSGIDTFSRVIKPRIHLVIPLIFIVLCIYFQVNAHGVCAQETQDLKSLNAQVINLYQAGKYTEAIPIAKKLLELTEDKFGPAGRLEALASSPHSSPDTLDNYHCIL